MVQANEKRAKLPTLHTRRLQAIAIIMYKVKNGLALPYITDLFVVTSSQFHLGNSDFTVPIFRTVAYGKDSLTYLGPVIWFKLDRSIRSSESLDIFLKSTSTWLISQACLTILVNTVFYLTTNN